MRGIEFQLGAKNRSKRNIWFISLFIADKTGYTSKILLEVRSSHPTIFFKNFANFTRKHLRWSHFLIKLWALIPATVLKRAPSLPFSRAYTYFNIFALCFISIEPSIFEYKSFCFGTDRYLFKILNKEKVNKKSMSR